MLKVGVNAARSLFEPFTLKQKFEVLSLFLEIFKRFWEKGEEWYVELGVSGFPELYVFKRNKIRINQTTASKIKRICEREGFKLTIHAPHSGEKVLPDLNLCSLDEKERKFSIEYAKATILLAKSLGSNIITFHPGYLYAKLEEAEEKLRAIANVRVAKENLVKSFRELVETAEEEEILLTLENMEPRIDIGYILINPLEVKEIVERVGSKWLRITYDCAHATLAAAYLGFDPVENFKKIRKYVVKIHIHDNLGKPSLFGKKDYRDGIGDLHLMPLIGRGIVPNEKILKLAGRNKLVIYEITPTSVEFAQSIARLREIFK